MLVVHLFLFSLFILPSVTMRAMLFIPVALLVLISPCSIVHAAGEVLDYPPSIRVIHPPTQIKVFNATSKAYADIHKGSNLTLECEGHRPLKWILQNDTIHSLPESDEIELTTNNTCQDGTCKTLLHISRITGSDTGGYTCAYVSNAHANTEMYIFVNGKRVTGPNLNPI